MTELGLMRKCGKPKKSCSTISFLPLNTENRVQSQDSPRRICKVHSANGTYFFLTTLVYSRRKDFVEHVKYTVPMGHIFFQLLWCTVAGKISWNM